MEITGQITYVQLAGGFWGIRSDDGKAYQPTHDLPSHVQKEGLHIRARVTPKQAFTIFMWGETVEVQSIQPV